MHRRVRSCGASAHVVLMDKHDVRISKHLISNENTAHRTTREWHSTLQTLLARLGAARSRNVDTDGKSVSQHKLATCMGYRYVCLR